MREIEGDLIELAKKGNFDVIAHGCNCCCVMGAGIAPQMAKAFGADQYPLEKKEYRGDYNKMGCIDYKTMHTSPEAGMTGPFAINVKKAIAYFPSAHKLYVVNAYTQYVPGAPSPDCLIPLDYDALTMCLKKINEEFKGLHIGLPLIGCGLAGGDWEYVKALIIRYLPDMKVTIVHYKK